MDCMLDWNVGEVVGLPYLPNETPNCAIIIDPCSQYLERELGCLAPWELICTGRSIF